MSTNIAVRTRIDEGLKIQAVLALDEICLIQKTFPRELIPNALTRKTIKNSKNGKDVYKAKDADDLFNQLGI